MQSWTKLMYVSANKSSSMRVIMLRNYCDSSKSVPPVVTRLLDRCAKPFIQKQPLELAKKLANDVLSHNNSAALTGIERPKVEEIFKSNQKFYEFNTPFERCSIELVESIPTELEFPGKECHTSTYDAWRSLLESAEKRLVSSLYISVTLKFFSDIVAFYWSLKDKTGYETSWQGKEILEAIAAAAQRGVKIRIAQHALGKQFQQEESADLAARGSNFPISGRGPNFAAYGGGVLHTKMWVVDNKHIFLGSANMDWRSLTEVKELGIVVRNNPSIALDMGKIFSVYWEMGDRKTPPHKWSMALETNYNEKSPLRLQCVMDDGKNDIKSKSVEAENVFQKVYKFFHYQSEDPAATSCEANVFLSSCPRELNPRGREHDLEFPSWNTFFMRRNNRYWPDIDNALRAAAFRGVKVDLLVSKWKHTKREMIPYLKSLLQINPALRSGQISVKVFTVPSDEKQSQIDHARVNHAKYLVTDKAAYIGTSNWAGDYFITTAGMSMVIESADSREIVERFNQVFLRDWNSEYAESLDL